ncbi:TIGR03943 family putative permease subunit [Streptomyces sp. NPDC020681]|uniref:TIGR03943 family putative permease subunit n=1 Tax=Streptomyces sp. NPDC020681 TaxID=3365083 RepID=UPI003797EAF0
MNRQAQAALLFLVGGAVLRASFTDLYLRYVKAGLRPLLIVAGIVLIVAGIATVWYEWRQPREAEANRPAREHDDQGGHAHREPRISWLLVLPLFALILVAPPALGSYSAMRTGTALQKPLGFPTLPAGDPLRLSVVDYAGRAGYDHGRSLADRRIKITGFISLDRSGAPYLTRMALNCCAADAQPVKIGLTGQIPPVMQPDAWLEVTGTYTTKRL